MKEEIEKYVVKYTRIIHPEDLGTPTSILENTLREMLENYTQSFIEAEIANEENAEAPADSEYDLEALHEGFFMAKQETISHLKGLLVIIKMTTIGKVEEHIV